MKILKNNVFAVDKIRKLVLTIRYLILRSTRGISKFEENKREQVNNTVIHNFRVFKEKIPFFDFSTRRVELLINAALAHESVNSDSEVLIVGPRTESDIYRLKGRGLSKIIGLDLISYSPMIKLGDMHKMPFQNDKFDLIISGWTISYSVNPEKFLKEAVRCLKNRGILAVAFSHYEIPWDPTKPTIERENKELIHLNEERKLNSVGDFIKLMDKTGVDYSLTSAHDALLRDMNKEERAQINGF